jgi:basic membrane lipoprotein Med (substrate-binding protein (PBP1-ABC) superfamily)
MGYLAGVLAASIARDGNKKVGVFGGQSIPPVKRFVNGFANAVVSTCPDCQVICGYGSGFSNEGNEGDKAADGFRQQDVDIVAHHAGSTGTALMKSTLDNEFH